MGSNPSPPPRPVAPLPPAVVKPVKENDVRVDQPERRPPMAHVGLGTIKIIKEAITKVKVLTTVLFFHVVFSTNCTGRMLLLFRLLRNSSRQQSSMSLVTWYDLSIWRKWRISFLQNWSLSQPAHWHVNESILLVGNRRKIALSWKNPFKISSTRPSRVLFRISAYRLRFLLLVALEIILLPLLWFQPW